MLTGGSKIDHLGGYFYEPTIIKDASQEMLVTCEETFGPLLALYPFDTEEEVVEKANNTSVRLQLSFTFKRFFTDLAL